MLAIDDPELCVFNFVPRSRSFVDLGLYADYLLCQPILHIDQAVAQFLHAMLLKRLYHPVHKSLFELVNVQILLLVHAKYKATL